MGFVVRIPTGFLPYYLTADGGRIAQVKYAKVFATRAEARRARDAMVAADARRGLRNQSGDPTVEEIKS